MLFAFLVHLFPDDIINDIEIQKLQSEIMENVKLASIEAKNHLKTFKKYEFIWKDDKEFHLEFLLTKCQEMRDERDEFDDHKHSLKDIQAEMFRDEVCNAISITDNNYFNGIFTDR